MSSIVSTYTNRSTLQVKNQSIPHRIRRERSRTMRSTTTKSTPTEQQEEKLKIWIIWTQFRIWIPFWRKKSNRLNWKFGHRIGRKTKINVGRKTSENVTFHLAIAVWSARDPWPAGARQNWVTSKSSDLLTD